MSDSDPDSVAVVRNILLHIAAGVLLPDTPPAAEALLVEDVTEVLGEMLLTEQQQQQQTTTRTTTNNNSARHDPSL